MIIVNRGHRLWIRSRMKNGSLTQSGRDTCRPLRLGSDFPFEQKELLLHALCDCCRRRIILPFPEFELEFAAAAAAADVRVVHLIHSSSGHVIINGPHTLFFRRNFRETFHDLHRQKTG